MGEITDLLRANLRELAQSDARLLRELDAAIPAGSPQPQPGSPGRMDATAIAQLDDGLDRLSLKDLKDLCKQRRIKGISRLTKDELIALLRSAACASSSALPAVGPAATTAATTATTTAAAPAATTTATAPEAASAAVPALAAALETRLEAYEARLERIEALLQRMAAHLGVS